MLRRKLAHIQLSEAFFIPGYGELKGRTLDNKTCPGIAMIMSDQGPGIDCTIKDTTFFIPFGSIKVAVYVVPERKETTNVKAA